MAGGIKARFITRKWPPAIGGMETYCVRISQEVSKRCDLERLSLPGRRDGRGPSAFAMLWFGLLKGLGTPFRRSVSVVHLGDMAIWPLGYVEKLFGRARRLILSAHGSDVSTIKRSSLYHAYLKLGARLLPEARVLANSSYIAEMTKSVGFVDVTVIPLGTDLIGIDRTPQVALLYSGRISRAKGLRFLVECILPLLPPSTRLRVAGPIWEESEEGLLKHPQIEYLGTLSTSELAAEYSQAAITLVPSRIEEGFGLVAIEAAACGSQVIASDGGGLREAVKAPWGELVDPEDPVAWVRVIKRRMSLGSYERNRMKEAAKRDVDKHFRWETAASRTFSQYID